MAIFVMFQSQNRQIIMLISLVNILIPEIRYNQLFFTGFVPIKNNKLFTKGSARIARIRGQNKSSRPRIQILLFSSTA